MLKGIFSLLLVAVCFEARVSVYSLAILNETMNRLSDSTKGFAYGLDISDYTTLDELKCLQGRGYRTVFIQGYTGKGKGLVDPYIVQNIKNAYEAKLGIEVYITPAHGKSSQLQVDELITALKYQRITSSRLWLKVTSPRDWDDNPLNNIEFIDIFLRRVLQYKITPGIFTSWYDWQQITENWNKWSSHYSVLLWYWSAFGMFENGMSKADFSDFREFSGYKTALVKSFALKVHDCSVVGDRIVYPENKLKYLTSGLSEIENPEIMIGFGTEIEGQFIFHEKIHVPIKNLTMKH